MSTPRQVIEQLTEAINRHDLEGCRRFFSTGAHIVTASGRELDLEGLGTRLQDTLAGLPDLRVTILRWVVDGETVVTEEVLEGTHIGHLAGLGPTGRTVRLPMAHIWRVRDGRIIERTAYHDTATILRQVAGPA